MKVESIRRDYNMVGELMFEFSFEDTYLFITRQCFNCF